MNLAMREISYLINEGVSEPLAICQIYDMILLLNSTFSFFAIFGVNDHTFYLNEGHLNEVHKCKPRFCTFLKYLLKNLISIYNNHIRSTFIEKILQYSATITLSMY